MRASKLILIDGLPGSGKTTTALAMAAQLRQRGMAAQCVVETAENGQDHPPTVGGPLHPAGATRVAARSCRAATSRANSRWTSRVCWSP